MNDYDLIAFDMDGTLLDSNKKFRSSSLEAISKAAAKGKIIALSTGRSMPELKEALETIKDLQYVIAVSGALVLNCKTNKVIYSNPIKKELVDKLFELTKNQDLFIHIHSDQSVIARNMLERMDEFQMGVYKEMFRKNTSRPEDIQEYVYRKNLPVYKFNIYSKTPEDREKLYPKALGLPLELVYSERTSIECSAKNVSKGNGLIKLCQELNIPLCRTIAVGDADNDLDILNKAGLAVAMANANQKVKEIADVIVDDNDSDGCAQAIYEYLLK